VYRGADILCGCTDAAGEVITGDWLEPGTHVTCVGGRPDARTRQRTDVWLRLGNATPAANFPDQRPTDENVAYLAQPSNPVYQMHRMGQRPRRAPQTEAGKPRVVSFEDMLTGSAAGRTTPEEITYSERGNIQGAQFFAVAGAAYEAAKRLGLGHEIPTEWLLQDIRD
jgi:ornithine cyclodeaminase/alanine dehydrogenase-like protein (mu-crystallin family)